MPVGCPSDRRHAGYKALSSQMGTAETLCEMGILQYNSLRIPRQSGKLKASTSSTSEAGKALENAIRYGSSLSIVALGPGGLRLARAVDRYFCDSFSASACVFTAHVPTFV